MHLCGSWVYDLNIMGALLFFSLKLLHRDFLLYSESFCD